MLTATIRDKDFTAGLDVIGATSSLYFLDGEPVNVVPVGTDFTPVTTAEIHDDIVYDAYPTRRGLETPKARSRRAWTLLLEPLLALNIAESAVDGALVWRRRDPEVRSTQLRNNKWPVSTQRGERGSWESRLVYVPQDAGEHLFDLVRVRFKHDDIGVVAEAGEAPGHYLCVGMSATVVSQEPQPLRVRLLSGTVQEEVLLEVHRSRGGLRTRVPGS